MSSGFPLSCPLPLPAKDRILIGHGSGGRLSAELMRDVFLPLFQSPVLGRMDDQAIVEVNGLRLAFTTDSFVVKPLFFRGGDIGSLAVHGTINDLAMGGAEPLFLSAAFILEEGLDIALLQKVAQSMAHAAETAGVEIVTGDTKVVEKGSGDQLFLNTTGIGLVRDGVHLTASNARPGDRILLSGYLGDHGIAILSEREGIQFDTLLESDSAALHTLVGAMLDVCPAIRCLRDPTRGGLSSALNEIAASAKAGMTLEETTIPIREEVRGACEMLGLDPLYVANEGKLIAIVPPEAAHAVLDAMRRHPLGTHSALIGTVTDRHPGMVTIRTAFGTTRIVDMLSGDQLPASAKPPMHEMSIATSLIEAVQKEATKYDGAKVLRVGVRVGEWSGVDVESLRFCFETLILDTDFAGAVLEIEFREKGAELDVAFLEFEDGS